MMGECSTTELRPTHFHWQQLVGIKHDQKRPQKSKFELNEWMNE